jgi:hypothetical protein
LVVKDTEIKILSEDLQKLRKEFYKLKNNEDNKDKLDFDQEKRQLQN